MKLKTLILYNILVKPYHNSCFGPIIGQTLKIKIENKVDNNIQSEHLRLGIISTRNYKEVLIPK